MKRVISMLLVLCFAMTMLASCGGGGESQSQSKPSSESQSQSQGGSESESGTDWTNVNFGGEELKISISVNQDEECTFPAADIYTRGPDHSSTDKVQKMVSERNILVSNTLGLSIVYEETDWKYDGVYPHLQQLVQLGGSDAPDIYNNDIYGMLRGMLDNAFRNVMDPDEDLGEESHFNFEADGWYWEYMQGTTFDPDKIYLIASDYFIDMIRMAWVIYVNVELYDEAWGSAYALEDLYRLTLIGQWDYSFLMQLAEESHRDTSVPGVTDEGDEVIGFVGNSVMPRVFVWTNGLTLVEYDENGYPGALRMTLPDYYESALGYRDLYNHKGVMATANVLGATELFLQKTSVMAMSVLGEMESEQVRSVEGLTKGVMPYPKYNMDEQKQYHTMVHDQAEIAAIMNTTSKFTEASAWLQMMAEESVAVLGEYYEKTLKLKYNDDPLNKQMIDLVHDTIDNPFESVMMSYITGASDVATNIYSLFDAIAKNNDDSFNSSYEGKYDAYNTKYEEIRQKYLDLD